MEAVTETTMFEEILLKNTEELRETVVDALGALEGEDQSEALRALAAEILATKNFLEERRAATPLEELFFFSFVGPSEGVALLEKALKNRLELLRFESRKEVAFFKALAYLCSYLGLDFEDFQKLLERSAEKYKLDHEFLMKSLDKMKEQVSSLEDLVNFAVSYDEGSVCLQFFRIFD